MSSQLQAENSDNQEKNIKSSYPSASPKFEWLYALTSFWLILGVHIDGWSHNNTPNIESFFTPSHFVLYTGMFAVTGLMLYYAYQNHKNGYDLLKSLPDGYIGVLIGSLVFFMGGIGDGLWHTILGIEVSVEALYSPTHLMLAIGGAMMLSGAFRQAWKLPEEFTSRKFRDQLPTIMSIGFFLSIITFFFQYAVPFHIITPIGDRVIFSELGTIGAQGFGTLGTVVYTVLFMGTVINLYQKFKEDLPPIVFTILLPINVFLASMMRFAIPGISNMNHVTTVGNTTRILFVLLGIIMGYLTDRGLITLHHSTNYERDLTILSIVLPFLLFSLYILAIAVTTGVGWSLHLAFGLPVLAGIAGYLTRLLLINTE